MTEELDIDDIERRMKGAVSVLGTEFAGLRTGRASAGMLEPVTVNAYGSNMPISQLGTVSVPEPRLLTVQVWDKSQVTAVEKAIRDSSLGLNPMTEGQLIRIPVPELNEERRQELTKVAAQYAEQARVAVRNVRRDGMDKLKRLEKDGHIGEDEHKVWADDLQTMTDSMIEQIDQALEKKDSEIMQV
jgi:ribosome recycling factor